jgi:hypothetical protein
VRLLAGLGQRRTAFARAARRGSFACHAARCEYSSTPFLPPSRPPSAARACLRAVRSLGPPVWCVQVFTVGATDNKDVMSYFSNFGEYAPPYCSMEYRCLQYPFSTFVLLLLQLWRVRSAVLRLPCRAGSR